MHNSFERVADILARLPGVEDVLQNANQYRAHRQHNPDSAQKPETLPEHVNLVNDYFARLVEMHGLDGIINQLIEALLTGADRGADDKIGATIKEWFVATAPYHDHGKVNENFQAHPDKMNNPAFTQTPNLIISTHHAKLGAYLYLYKHFLDFTQLRVADATTQRRISFVLLMLAYPIIRHHGSRLKHVDLTAIHFTAEELACMAQYIPHYGYKYVSPLAIQLLLPQTLQDKYFRFSGKPDAGLTFDFALFALLRLNFSLLTAADYLATSAYMQQAGIDDFGVLDDTLRAHIETAVRTTKPYNQDAFRLANEADWQAVLPTERSGDALNRLRLTMAVEVIRAIRQNADKRLFYLEAPTGGGKTNLSMLAAAELLRLNPELNKVFYVFPFTTLITQTYKAILETWQLSESDVGLMHSKAGFQQKEQNGEGEYGPQWRNQLHNQFAHFPVCLLTHIRFFDILKSDRKDSIYLMHRLANSVVIIDELQSYPPDHWDKMLFWIDQYAEYFNIRFVLMSATLPRIDKLTLPLSNRPNFCDLLPNAKAYFTNVNFRDRVRFRFDLLETPGSYKARTINLSELTQTVLNESRQYADAHDGRVFTIVEFIYKKSATDFATQITGQYFDKVLVLSGTILEPRRREVINYLKREGQKKEPLKVLLVTTQVVEAGVDIDMDLGFKNVSLIDSDEQLAGRINRNITKDVCEVFLFRMDGPGVLYNQDPRFDAAKGKPDLHKEILDTKDFGKLYDIVIRSTNKLNSLDGIDNFNKYNDTIRFLNYPEAHKQFELIEAKNLSVFVPIALPIRVDAVESGEQEAIFSPMELQFLQNNDAHEANSDTVDGTFVWELFRSMNNSNVAFTNKQINKKIVQGILSKFTFSIFYTDKIKLQLTEFSNPLESFDTYLYLSHHRLVYDYKNGLDQSKFTDSANSIL